MKRLSWLLRQAFQQWMWEGGDTPTRAQQAARRLPLYFSDPDAYSMLAYSDEIRAWTATEFPNFWADWNSAEYAVWDGPSVTTTAGAITSLYINGKRIQ